MEIQATEVRLDTAVAERLLRQFFYRIKWLRKGGRHEKTKNISDAVLVPVPVQHGLYGLCDRAGYDHTADHQTYH